MAVVLAIAAISYGAMYVLLRDHAEEEVQGRARLTAGELAHDLGTFALDMARLADTSLLVNGLLDSLGRETYLVPFLRNYRSPLPMAVGVVVCDFLGRPIASNGGSAAASYAGYVAVRTALETGRAHAEIIEGGTDTPVLLLAQPMFYPATRQVEGVLVGSVNLRDILLMATRLVDSKHHTLLLAEQSLIAASAVRASAKDWFKSSQALALTAPLDTLKLQVSVRIGRDEALRTLFWVTWIYLVIGAVTLVAVILLVRYMAHRLTEPLNALNRTAHHIAATGAIDTRAPVAGTDEIGSLASIFNSMLDRLAAFQNRLEKLVAERTAELRQSEGQLTSILESMSDVVWSVSPQTFEILYVNSAAERVYGRGVDELIDNPELWIEAIHESDRDLVAQTFLPTLLRDGTAGMIYRIVRPDGEVRWVEDRGRVIRDADGNAERLDGMVTDITVRRQAEEALRQSEQKLGLHVEQTPLGVIEWDVDFRVTRWNPAAERIFGYTRAEVLGRRADDLIVPENAGQEVKEVWTRLMADKGGRRSTNSNVTKHGRIIECEWYNTPLTDEAGNVIGAASLVQDITETKRYQSELEHLATHDALTGLPNRNLLNDRLTQAVHNALRYGRSLLVAFVDIDRFRLVNESLGHSVGDELLKMVTERLNTLVRESDTVARLGGDEFVILSGWQKDEETPLQIVQRVLTSLAQPYVIESDEVYLTCGIGIALYPRDGSDGQTLLRNAGAALNRAKQLGHNNFYFYTVEINASANEELTLQRNLRRATDENEFLLHYQPKIDLATGCVCGLEALLRWREPERGLLLPGEFIPVLEETGMIEEVGQWVIETAAADYARLLSQGLRLPRIAVNVSPLQLRRKDFRNRLMAAAGKWHDPREWLDIEITESLLMEDIKESAAKLAIVQEMGVGIAIDDFGTGHSSLNYLARLPISALKIDASFISRLMSSADDVSIVSMIISLGHSLKIRVVAEGVENEEQQKLLRLLGCDEMQGFLVCRPVPIDDIIQAIVLPTVSRNAAG